MEAPEGAPADWSEKYSMLMQKSADMVTTELPNLQEFCNKMDQFIAADKAYRAGYSETKATIGDKTWDDGVPGTQARCYFIGVWQGANAMFGEEMFPIEGKMADTLKKIATDGAMDTFVAELKDAGVGLEELDTDEAKEDPVKAAAKAAKAKVMAEVENKIQELKDEIRNAIEEKKKEVINKFKDYVKGMAEQWVEENIKPKVVEVIDECLPDESAWIPVEKLQTFAMERIMGFFQALIDQIVNGKFDPAGALRDATANPLAGMSPKEMLAAGFEASKECGAFDEMHEAVEDVKEAVEEVKEQVQEAVDQVKEVAKDAIEASGVDEIVTEEGGKSLSDKVGEAGADAAKEAAATAKKKAAGIFNIKNFIPKWELMGEEQLKRESKKAKMLLAHTFVWGTTLSFLFTLIMSPGFPFGTYKESDYAQA
jgi:ElaB/YqjD/DUF883 family membrane-anchored ribosome-binding protein